MIPAIAIILAAYTIPRIILATMAYCAQVPVERHAAQTSAILLCIVSVLGILFGLSGVMFAGRILPTPGL
jgi:hypothetical protein